MNTVVSSTSNSANLPADFSLVSHFFLLHPSLKAKRPRCSYFSLRDWIYPHGFNHQSCMDNYQFSIPALTFSWAPMLPSNTPQVGTVIRLSTTITCNSTRLKSKICVSFLNTQFLLLTFQAQSHGHHSSKDSSHAVRGQILNIFPYF